VWGAVEGGGAARGTAGGTMPASGSAKGTGTTGDARGGTDAVRGAWRVAQLKALEPVVPGGPAGKGKTEMCG
jgi:hypothetical protein